MLVSAAPKICDLGGDHRPLAFAQMPPLEIERHDVSQRIIAVVDLETGINASVADRVVAFWDGKSRGTLNAIYLATRAGLPVEIFGPDGQRVDVAVALVAAEGLGVVASIKSGEARQS